MAYLKLVNVLSEWNSILLGLSIKTYHFEYYNKCNQYFCVRAY